MTVVSIDLRQRDDAREQQIGVDRLTHLHEIDTVAEVRCRRREHVTTGERDTRRFEQVVGVGERHDPSGAAGHRDRRGEQAVVGTDHHALAVGDLHGDAAARRADAGVDRSDDHTRRDVADRSGESE